MYGGCSTTKGVVVTGLASGTAEADMPLSA
jgi:hypothetical protein